jgi:hypothetical protein
LVLSVCAAKEGAPNRRPRARPLNWRRGEKGVFVAHPS